MDDMRWNILSCEYLFREPWFTVRREGVELPNGRRMTYHVLEYGDWVNTVAVTKTGEFVLVRQYRRGLDETCFELCAGACDPEDTSPLESAQRELLEETGYGGGTWRKLMSVSPNAGTHTNMTHCFLALDVEKVAAQDLDPTEDLSVHLFSLEEVKELLRSGGIKQSLMAAPLWRYMAELHGF